ncbi:hypothetical protein Ancab_028300 [Ancistrocladus abbreviatus]
MGVCDQISQAPPNPQSFKMKSDAAQDKEGNLGLSLVIQDMVGDVLACGGRRCFMVCKSSIAETLALLFGIQTAQHLGLFPLSIETNAFEGSTQMGNELSMLIAKAKQEALRYGITSCLFTPRESNLVAHFSPKFALNLDDEYVWSEEYPEITNPCVL